MQHESNHLQIAFFALTVLVVASYFCYGYGHSTIWGSGDERQCFRIKRRELWMDIMEDEQKRLVYSYHYPMQANTADFVVLAAQIDPSYVGKPLPEKFPLSKLKVLLIKRGPSTLPANMRGLFSTPGGFVEASDITVDDTAARELREEAGLVNVLPQQLFVASKLGRDPRYKADTGIRVISVYYGAIVVDDSLPPPSPQGAELGEVALSEWVPLDNLPDIMAFDHKENLEKAVEMMLTSRRLEFVVQQSKT